MMSTRTYFRLAGSTGFTLIEVLIALLLSSVVTIAAFKFYESESNSLLTQENIAETQQSLRSSLFEVSSALRNCGANLPEQIVALSSGDSNPDTLLVRFAESDQSLNVSILSEPEGDFPINVPLGSDMTRFPVGASVYYWHNATVQGEWFTITSINSNIGTGFEEVFHVGTTLLSGPRPGDMVIAMSESIFYIDNADTNKPLLMRASNGQAAQVYAENINDFQIDFVLKSADTVSVLGVDDTVLIAMIFMSAMTRDVDVNLVDFNKDGRRVRTLNTDVMIRNGRNQ